MRTSLTLYSFRFTVLSSLGLLHGCGGSVSPGPTRSSTEGATTGNATTGSATGTTTGTGTGTTTGSGTGTTGTSTGATTGSTTGTTTGTSTGTTTGVVTATGTTTGTGTGTTTGTGTGSGTGTVMSVCDGPETDLGNGLSECANGTVHRAQVVACSNNYEPRPEAVQDRFEFVEVAAGGVAAGGAAFEDPGVGGAAADDGTGFGGSGVGDAAFAGSPAAPFRPVGGAGGAGSGTPPPSFNLAACTYDTDCTEGYGGLCDAYYETESSVLSYCWYNGCVTDADCGEGQVCNCNDGANQCSYSSTCTTDADCSDGNVCARFEYDDCGATVSYACTSPADGCRFNEDCGDVATGATCFPSWDPAMPGAQCGGIRCVEGRPFLVDGVARVATIECRTDWTLPRSPKLLDLTDAERRHLSGEWQRTALAEHASIAAFARFALDLLAIGAPPELLESTQQAMRDETLHAKLAFGLASGYAGRGIGPGPLSCDGALAAHDLESITLNTVLEGCIGETLAALDAQHALEQCADPVVRAVLEQIAQDEAKHADLAWKFVQWALTQEPSLAARVESLVERELAKAKLETSSSSAETAWTRRHGVLPQADRVALRLSALEQVVVPCMRALCATVPSVEANPKDANRGAATTLVA